MSTISTTCMIFLVYAAAVPYSPKLALYTAEAPSLRCCRDYCLEDRAAVTTPRPCATAAVQLMPNRRRRPLALCFEWEALKAIPALSHRSFYRFSVSSPARVREPSLGLAFRFFGCMSSLGEFYKACCSPL